MSPPLASLALAALMLTACGGSSASDAGGGASVTQDGALPDAPEADAGICVFGGDYVIVLGGVEGLLRFVDGTWSFDASALGRGTASADYAVEGDVLIIYNPAPGIPEPPPECFPDVAGRYSMSFSDDCSAVLFTVVSDPCAPRVAWLDGATLTRLP